MPGGDKEHIFNFGHSKKLKWMPIVIAWSSNGDLMLGPYRGRKDAGITQPEPRDTNTTHPQNCPIRGNGHLKPSYQNSEASHTHRTVRSPSEPQQSPLSGYTSSPIHHDVQRSKTKRGKFSKALRRFWPKHSDKTIREPSHEMSPSNTVYEMPTAHRAHELQGGPAVYEIDSNMVVHELHMQHSAEELPAEESPVEELPVEKTILELPGSIGFGPVFMSGPIPLSPFPNQRPKSMQLPKGLQLTPLQVPSGPTGPLSRHISHLQNQQSLSLTASSHDNRYGFSAISTDYSPGNSQYSPLTPPLTQSPDSGYQSARPMYSPEMSPTMGNGNQLDEFPLPEIPLDYDMDMDMNSFLLANTIVPTPICEPRAPISEVPVPSYHDFSLCPLATCSPSRTCGKHHMYGNINNGAGLVLFRPHNVCPDCGRAFKGIPHHFRRNLRRHRERHCLQNRLRGLERFVCRVQGCHSSYTRADGRKDHEERKHGLFLNRSVSTTDAPSSF